MARKVSEPAAPQYTPKEYFSASALALAARCLRAYGFRYLDGEKEPELPYEYFLEPEHIAEAKGLPEFQRMQWYSMRSKALGKAIHFVLETYFLGWAKHGYVEGHLRAFSKADQKAKRAAAEAIDWTTPQGVIARAMADELPHPSECEEIYTEAEITIDTSKLPACKGSDPVQFTGLADLIVKFGGYWVLFDYKSTKSVVNKYEELGYNYVKSKEELREDPQSALYSLHAMQKTGIENLECGWVYGQTKDKPRSAITKFNMGLVRATNLVNALAIQATGLRAIMRSGKKAMDLEGNPKACDMMGGCQYHVTRGGRCEVKQSLGDQLVQLTTKANKKAQDKPMGSFADDLAKARKDASDKKSKAPAGDAKGKAAAKPKGKAKDEDEEEEEEEEEEEAEKPAKKASTKKAPGKPKAPVEEEEEEEEEKAAKKGKKDEDKDPSDACDRAISYTHTLTKEGFTITVVGPDESAVEGIADKIVVEILAD